MELEIENKSIISKTQYDYIWGKYSNQVKENILQINYYYDTQEKNLFHSGETLRVRQIGDSLTLQHKTHKTHEGNTRVSKEFSLMLKYMPRFISVNDQRFFYIGEMLTHRIEISFSDYTVFLDSNMYLGKIDYEIEIESNSMDKMPQNFEGIDFSPHNSKGKYSRFIYELKRLAENNGMELNEKD